MRNDNTMTASAVAVGAAMLAYGLGITHGHQDAADNVRVSAAALESIEHMHGQANKAVEIRYGYKFRTDSAGRVEMLYADGWQCVEQEC